MAKTEFYTVKTLAKEFDTGERVIQRAALRKDLKGRKIGGRWRFTKRAVDEWIDTGNQ